MSDEMKVFSAARKDSSLIEWVVIAKTQEEAKKRFNSGDFDCGYNDSEFINDYEIIENYLDKYFCVDCQYEEYEECEAYNIMNKRHLITIERLG